MKQVMEIAEAVFGIAVFIGMWCIACMIGVIPLLVGLWLWRAIF